MSLMKKFPAPSAKSLLVALSLIATLSAIVIAVKKRIHGSRTYGLGIAALVIPNDETEDIIKLLKNQIY